jgi:hypothetical protein
MPASTRQTALVWFAISALALFSAGLALARIYQVDEAQNLYMARIAVRGEAGQFYTTAALDLLPLGWMAQQFSSSAAIFTTARVIFLLLFWLNIALLSVATQTPLRSRAGAWVTLGAATLAPLWDYGIEIRHDNVLLSGLLSMWILGQPSIVYRPWRYAYIGACTALLQFVAVKAFLYTLPVSFLTLVLPSLTPFGSVRRRAVSWAIGLFAGLALVRGFYGVLGLWDAHLASYGGMATGLKKLVPPVEHSFTLERLLVQTPLLLAGTLAALVVCVARLQREGWNASLWSRGLAEAVLFAVAFGAFLTNPTPFPYNLLLLVPFAFLLVVRVLRASLDSLPVQSAWFPWIVGLIVFAHTVPFAHASMRHLAWTNTRQQDVMAMAEALTDENTDRVYDASGLVVTRLATQRWWYIHSLNLPGYGTPAFPRMSEALLKRPAAVFIRSYRTDWLPPEDQAFIAAHYIPLADDFWALGTMTDTQRTWNCLLGGRYALQLEAASDGTPPSVLLDGTEVSPGVLTLSAGTHELRIRGTGRAALVWLGPHLQTAPYLPQSNHELLFVNWY